VRSLIKAGTDYNYFSNILIWFQMTLSSVLRYYYQYGNGLVEELKKEEQIMYIEDICRLE